MSWRCRRAGPATPTACFVLAARYAEAAARPIDAALDASIAAHQREVDAYSPRRHRRIARSMGGWSPRSMGCKAAAPGTEDEAVAVALADRIPSFTPSSASCAFAGSATPRAPLRRQPRGPDVEPEAERDSASMLDLQLASRGAGGTSDRR